jgi:hypothetical protein
MRTNPFADAIAFLTGGTDGHMAIGWGGPIFVTGSTLLVIGSLAVAASNWAADPQQRSLRHVTIWLMRALIGGMWLEGSLWKLPLPVSGGLSYWMDLMGANAAFDIYGTAIKSILIPALPLLNPLIFLVEITLAASLMLGIGVRFGAMLGVAMSLNLWIGLYHYQPEWPWIYLFIAMLHVFFALDNAGGSLGLSAILRRRRPAWFVGRPWLAMLG